MSVGRQLLKEFAVPFVVAAAWTAYSFFEMSPNQWTIRSAVNIFGPAFFFASWLAAQWFRVKKQQGVEKGLETIERSVQDTLAKLDSTADHLAGHITGGDSVCYLYGPQPENNLWTNLLFIHSGNHPLYEVSVRIGDIDEFQKCLGDDLKFQQHIAEEKNFSIGNLIPGHCQRVPLILELGHSDYRRFNIFYTARNGSFCQLLRCKRVSGMWVFATRVLRDGAGNGQVFFEKIDENFLQGASEVAWDD